MRRILILGVALSALAATAQAGERCVAPYAPTIKLPANASKQDLTALRDDAAAFMAASDVYQKCMVAKGGAEDQIHDNQLAKQRVGKEFNALLHSFQSAHSGVSEIAQAGH